MEYKSLIAGSAIGGLIITFWGQISAFLSRIRSFVIVEVTIDSYLIRQAFIYYCWTKLKRVKLGGDYSINATEKFVLSKRKWKVIPFENVGQSSIVFLKGIKPIFMAFKKEQNQDSSLKFNYFRWSFKLDELINDAVTCYEQAKDEGLSKTRFEIIKLFGSIGEFTNGNQAKTYDEKPTPSAPIIEFADKRIIGYNLKDITAQENYNGKEPFDVLAVPENILIKVKEAKKWRNHKYWYISRNVPWKLGWLLYGTPGTGKTSLVKAVGYELDLPIYVFSLSTFDNQSFTTKWQRMKESTPCIALFEDIDTVFHGRNNINKNMEGTALTFDTLLNCIDGIEDSSGIFTIITTNKPEYLDEALGKIENNKITLRPGRIDTIIHMEKLDKKCRRQIANRILADIPEKIEETVLMGDGETGAEFQKRCADIARNALYENKINTNNEEIKDKPPEFEKLYLTIMKKNAIEDIKNTFLTKNP